MLIERTRKRLAADRASFVEPCLPSPADRPPSGPNWIHEIKHDGFRRMARRDPVGIRLITRRGNDWTSRFPLVVEAVNHLKVRSCLIDGEAVCCNERGWPGLGFAVVTTRRKCSCCLRPVGAQRDRSAPEPMEVRKATLASILRKSRHGVRLNEHLEHDCGADGVPACLQDGPGGDRLEAARFALSFGTVAGLARSRIRQHRRVRREAEEDWGRRS